MTEFLQEEEIIETVRRWVQTFVVDLNLCPFAGREMARNRVRYAVSNATTEASLLVSLQDEITLLNDSPSLETSLLIHPQALRDFPAYNQFLDQADELLVQMNFEGVYQVASFHPLYQFADTEADDAGNFTNRSPYPLLHLLREKSVENAVVEYPDVDKIPARNIERMNSLGIEKLSTMLNACAQSSASD